MRKSADDCSGEDSKSDALCRPGRMPSSSKEQDTVMEKVSQWSGGSTEKKGRGFAQFSAQWGKGCKRKITMQARV